MPEIIELKNIMKKEIMSNDLCKCSHDFSEHTRKIGVSPYTNSGHTDIACIMCACGDYIPTPYTQMTLGF